MNKKAVILIVVVIVVLVGGGVIWAVHNNSNKENNEYGSGQNSSQTSGNNSNDMNGMDMNTPENSNSGSSSSSTPSTTSSVTIQNFAFSPANITVKKGTTVTWTNKDSTPHTVVETDGQDGPVSDNLANGKSYSFTYNNVGTYKYHCSIHPNMVGTVTVTE